MGLFQLDSPCSNKSKRMHEIISVGYSCPNKAPVLICVKCLFVNIFYERINTPPLAALRLGERAEGRSGRWSILSLAVRSGHLLSLLLAHLASWFRLVCSLDSSPWNRYSSGVKDKGRT